MSESTAAVMAIGCHPDDIEFMMAGTLLLLKGRGWNVHYMNLADGSCGSLEHDAQTTAAVRADESRNAAACLEAVWHPPCAVDIEVNYDLHLIRKVAAVIRKANPDILLIPSLFDYMEDHMFTARIAATAAFVKGMPNFNTDPEIPHVAKEMALYHALPYGLRDAYNKPVRPDFVIDIEKVLPAKETMLAKHESQQSWLDETQKINSYVETMKSMGAEVGAIAGNVGNGEGWIRHNPLGYSTPGYRPLEESLESEIHFIPG